MQMVCVVVLNDKLPFIIELPTEYVDAYEVLPEVLHVPEVLLEVLPEVLPEEKGINDACTYIMKLGLHCSLGEYICSEAPSVFDYND